ncbi:heterogeneous nuclear ribonucleoprotein Q [Trifolium repens]|nr:heterogeneous nuclear ribonucleoprotein Q [Trifolium repens]
MREKPRERGRGDGWREGGKVYQNGRNFSKKGNRIMEGEVTTLYFTNFPDHLTVADLWEKFACFWRVDEVYIPSKLDRKGNRFGFVRFWEVQNVEKLLSKIEGIWFDTYKLRANLAMHRRDDKPEKKGKQANIHPTPVLRDGGEVRKGVSFKHSLMNEDLLNQKTDKERVGVKNPVNYNNNQNEKQRLDGTMEVEVVEENLKKLENCWVGKLWNHEDVDKIQFKIWMEGFQTVNATWLGLDLILLSSGTKDGVKNAVECNTDWWSRVFVEIKPWTPLSRPRGRRVWVRIFGTPLHVWGEDCFNKVVWRFAKFVKMDEATEKQQRLDFARVQVLINYWGKIDESVDIRVGDDLFVLRVVEEQSTEVMKMEAGVCEPMNRAESNASIGFLEKRWAADDDGLQDDWSGASSPARPLRLASNVVAVGPLDNSFQQQLPSDTPVHVDISLGGNEGIFQIPNRVLSEEIQKNKMEKVIVVVPDTPVEAEGVGAAVDLVGCRELGTGQQLIGLGVEMREVKEVGLCRGKEKVCLGQEVYGPGDLLKGSCSLWAHPNTFGPLRQFVQQEGETIHRATDAEVARLDLLEELNKSKPLVGGPGVTTISRDFVCRRKGVANSKKKNKKKNNKANSNNQGVTKCIRFASAVKGARRTKQNKRSGANPTLPEGATQASDPIQDSADTMIQEQGGDTQAVSDVNSYNCNSLVDGVFRGEQINSVNYRIQAERLFNIGMNLGISSNEDRISMVERLIDSEGVEIEPEEGVGDAGVDQ